MNILELDSYRLSDAVKFNDRLNPKIFGPDEKMLPAVREHLLAIAADFQEFLGVNDYNLKDITISGSNAAYTYTPHSDIDLHLVADLPEADNSDVYRELFDAKKYQYNDQHDITIGGYDVELYVQNANQVHHSQGIYSVRDDRWISVPKRRRPEVSDISVQSKYEDLKHRIQQAIKSGDYDTQTALIQKIKDMRQAGLDTTGEFGPENLAFKILRTQNLIKDLFDARNHAKDKKLSMDEARKKKKKNKKKVRYGFGGYWYPGYGYYAGQNNDVTDSGGDGGGGDGGGESVQERAKVKISGKKIPLEQVALAFVAFAAKELKLKSLPIIILRGLNFSKKQQTFGHYVDAEKTIEVETQGRHIMDVMRTLAHELVHYRQHQQNKNMPKDAGATGSKYENEAHAVAGVIMRHFQNKYPKFFTAKIVDEDYSANDRPPGPETPPTMPAGTVRVDVSDVYDWYKLGQHISNMKGLGKHDFGAGPPSTVLSFGDEDTEHKFIKDLDATGLDVTDIDPRDPKQPAGMRKIKTDPTYNVDESPESHIKSKLASRWKNIKEGREEQLDEEDLFELKMSPSALEAWARSPEAEGIQAGFEAEMIFRNATREDEDFESEPDYDYDERAYDLEGILDFFSNDDWGYGLYGEAKRIFERQFDESYYEWADERLISDFNDEAQDLIRTWIEENEWDWEDSIREALDNMGLSSEDVDRIMELQSLKNSERREIPQSGTDQQKADYEKYSQARDSAEEELDSRAEQSTNDQDGIYDSALEEFRENWEYPDQSEFLNDNGWRYMSDVANEFDLEWPYWTSGNDWGGRKPDEIANNLESVVGMEVVGSSSYHGTTRKPNRWIIEPDGSLSGDENTDAGLEIVSPPMPLLTAIEKLKAVIEWGNSDDADAYTNSSTGLHMGISIPFKGGDVDYVKLILFMGDEYVLEKFGRMSNHYCESALKKLRQMSRSTDTERQEKIAAAMTLMKNNLLELAQREVQNRVGESKYTSVHIQSGYVEFRSPGGDYLAMESNNEFDDIKNTMLRFARAMYIAGRPDLERKEYGKKLYKLIAPQGGNDFELFARYSAGEMTADQLKAAWAQKIIDKELPKPKGTRWKLFTSDTHQPIQNSEFNGYTYDEAMKRAKENVSPGSTDVGFNKAYTLVDMTPNGKWDVVEFPSVVQGGMPQEYRVKATLEYETRGEAVDEAYRIFPGEEFYVDVHPEFKAPEKPKLSARAQLAKRIKEPRPPAPTEPTSDEVKKDNAQDSAELQQQIQDIPVTVDQDAEQPAQSTQQTSNYEIYDPLLNVVVSRAPNATYEYVTAKIGELEQEMNMRPGSLRVRTY